MITVENRDMKTLAFRELKVGDHFCYPASSINSPVRMKIKDVQLCDGFGSHYNAVYITGDESGGLLICPADNIVIKVNGRLIIEKE